MNAYEAVRLLAKIFGLEMEYIDNYGRTLHTPYSIAREILETKGLRIDPHLLRTSPQIVTMRTGDVNRRIPLYFDASASFFESLVKNGEIRLADSRRQFEPLIYLPNTPGVSIDRDSNSGLVKIFFPLPDNLPPGDYRLVAEIRAENVSLSNELIFILAPDLAYAPEIIDRGARVAGVSISLYGLRSDNNWGFGDFSDLLRFIDWAGDDLGAHFVGVNPLHALFNTQPYNCSPYMPSSRMFYNFIYLDVLKVAEYVDKEVADSIRLDREIMAEVERLRSEQYVDYEGVSQLKLRALRRIFDSFYSCRLGDDPQQKWIAFQSYLDFRGDDLDRFATFCVLRESLLRNAPNLDIWPKWPDGFRHPESPEVLKFKTRHTKEVLFYCFIQWMAEQQLEEAQSHATRRGMLVGLYHDVALAVDPYGADSWSRQEFFVNGFGVGAPPDAFAPEGQDWGFQPPNVEYSRNSGFALFRGSLSSNSRYGGAIRIDHVMQIHHLFWIPRGMKPKDGVYVKDYEEDLLNVITLESSINKNMVVGEDLGTLPFNFRERLIERGIFSYRIFYFERDQNLDQIPFYNYPARALVSLSNHDLPTFAGFWQGLDIQERISLGRIKSKEEAAIISERMTHKGKIIERLVQDGTLAPEYAHSAWESETLTDELHSAVIEFVLKTPSHLALISIEDLMGDTRQQNLPGTTHERPNWVTKTKFTLEELKSHPDAIRMAAKFRNLVLKSGRFVEFKA
ncbi:MAG: 4-alpha-glucanotransferase [Desulfomonilaceae bacterium]